MKWKEKLEKMKDKNHLRRTPRSYQRFERSLPPPTVLVLGRYNAINVANLLIPSTCIHAHNVVGHALSVKFVFHPQITTAKDTSKAKSPQKVFPAAGRTL